MSRRGWAVALLLYAAAGVAYGSFRLAAERRANVAIGPAQVSVAFAAGLFWPVDLVARLLLASH